MILNISSWNILNPEPYISYMSWKNFITHKSQTKIIAKIDYSRFKKFRSKAIIEIILWLFNKSPIPIIICLQEVHPLIVEQLIKEINADQIAIESESNVNNLVTIVSKSKIISHEKIQLDNKIALLCKIKLDNDVTVISANIHFYWKWDNNQIIYYGNLLVQEIQKYNYPFIISGDFNKNIDQLKDFINLFDCLLYNNNSKHNSIDHIFFSNEFYFDNEKTVYKIVNKILNYHIYYKFKKILKISDLNTEKWISHRPNNDISDHKIVFVKNIHIK
jgi:hypothetical protein